MLRATSDNLPILNMDMICHFFTNNADFVHSEYRHEKFLNSTREEYGDIAIGWITIEETGSLKKISMKITPEHNVRNSCYETTTTINERNKTIVSSICNGCVSSQGGCKHVVASISWLFRRSVEPSPTSIISYWRKPLLSQIKTGDRVIEVEKMKGTGSFKAQNVIPNLSIFEKWKKLAVEKEINCQLTPYFTPAKDYDAILMVNLSKNYSNQRRRTVNFNGFLKFCGNAFNQQIINKVEELTREQAKSKLWRRLRYGRITASRFHEFAHCKTVDGTLTEIVLGGLDIAETDAMKRGKILEADVFDYIKSSHFPNIKKCGFFVSSEYPLFGASPDGITDDSVIEIKCPYKDSTTKNYINAHRKLMPTVKSQVQLQMALTGKTKGFVIVASPNFEQNKQVDIFEEKYDPAFVKNLVDKSLKFYEKSIFKSLFK